jgi:hypothetical protein
MSKFLNKEEVQALTRENKDSRMLMQQERIAETINSAACKGFYNCVIKGIIWPRIRDELLELGYTVKFDNTNTIISWEDNSNAADA